MRSEILVDHQWRTEASLSSETRQSVKGFLDVSLSGVRQENVNYIKRDPSKDSLLLKIGQKHYFCKVFYGSGNTSRIRQILLKRRMQTNATALTALKETGVKMPSLDAIIMHSHQGCSSRPYYWELALFYEFIDDCQTFTQFIQSDKSDADKKAVIDDVLSQLLLIHKTGLAHGDMKPNNILVKHGRACFIDLEGLGRKTAAHSAEKDLARLIVGLLEYGPRSVDIPQLVKVYAGQMHRPFPSLYKRIKKYTDKILDRHQRKYKTNTIGLPDL